MDTSKTITHVGLCAGYGGIELGLQRVIGNMRSVALCEIEAFAVANLVAKMEAGLMDPAPIWPNLKTFPWQSFRDRVDILTGGYPCQPFSAAGQRKGKDDPRHLWPWIAEGIQLVRPRLCFFENVEGHISLGLSDVIEDLAGMGYRTTWGIFSAAEVGAPHQRKRVFILAYRKNERLNRWATERWEKPHREERPEIWDQSFGQGDCGEELADAGRQQPQGRGDFAEGQQSGAGRIPRNQSAPRHDQVWPSRPGEQQFAWEPPRVVGNAAQREDYGREPGDMEGEAGKWRCGDHAADGAGEAMGIASDGDSQRDSLHLRQGQAQHQGASGSVDEGWRQTQPPLGGNTHGSSFGMDYSELCVSSENRTDELRLLGNGVVPATAELAFRTLLKELA